MAIDDTRRHLLKGVAAAATIAALPARSGERRMADLILRNARITTLDPAQPSASAIAFADGSTGTLHYLAQAAGALPKERFEVSGGGRTAQCDNFRETRLVGGRSHKTVNQDKGQETAVAEVLAAVRGGAPSPFRLDDILAVSRTTFAIARALDARDRRDRRRRAPAGLALLELPDQQDPQPGQ